METKMGEENIKSNFAMCRDFDLKPEHYGISTDAEVKQIREHFRVAERSNIELQNLRDFVVMFFHMRSTEGSAQMEQMDVMSAITGVIDSEKFKRGMPV